MMQEIPTIPSSEITPEPIYLSRRKFMLGIGSLALSSALLAACGGAAPATPSAKAVSYTHLRANETVLGLVCRLLLEKKKSRSSDPTLLAQGFSD